ncbi:MAG: tungsten ABC transporter substrate-binding protein [Gammaproteobacteria bacterium]|nr:MAG: tungsten ABC transporter substrate-binding protein [Gammaproteobacteria bacterium]
MKNIMNKILHAVLIAMLAWSGIALAEDHLRLATTTSTADSGLLEVLNPAAEAALGAKIDVIAVGSGKALKLGENGDVDVLLVHDPEAEEKFVTAGFGSDRQPVMHNDFILLGPTADPAGVRQATDISDAMRRISGGVASFVSRGDESGTHQKELRLWRAAQIEPSGRWYLSVGQGMGAVLKIADDKLAYTLADRGTYLALRGQLELEVVFADAEELFNPYHVILIDPAKHPHVKHELARKYSEFIRGEAGQKIIRDFKIDGETLFHPDVIH